MENFISSKTKTHWQFHRSFSWKSRDVIQNATIKQSKKKHTKTTLKLELVSRVLPAVPLFSFKGSAYGNASEL